MIDVVPTTADMATRITGKSFTGLDVTEETLAVAIARGLSLAVVDDNRILGIGGLIQEWPERYVAWAVIAHGVSLMEFRHIRRTCGRILSTTKYPRVEMHVLSGFGSGCNWARSLGFRYEGLLRNWYGKQDFEMWARTA